MIDPEIGVASRLWSCTVVLKNDPRAPGAEAIPGMIPISGPPCCAIATSTPEAETPTRARRETPGFCLTVKLTVPLPVPLAALVSNTHSAFEVMLHAQPVPALTAIE